MRRSVLSAASACTTASADAAALNGARAGVSTRVSARRTLTARSHASRLTSLARRPAECERRGLAVSIAAHPKSALRRHCAHPGRISGASANREAKARADARQEERKRVGVADLRKALRRRQRRPLRRTARNCVPAAATPPTREMPRHAKLGCPCRRLMPRTLQPAATATARALAAARLLPSTARQRSSPRRAPQAPSQPQAAALRTSPARVFASAQQAMPSARRAANRAQAPATATRQPPAPVVRR